MPIRSSRAWVYGEAPEVIPENRLPNTGQSCRSPRLRRDWRYYRNAPLCVGDSSSGLDCTLIGDLSTTDSRIVAAKWQQSWTVRTQEIATPKRGLREDHPTSFIVGSGAAATDCNDHESLGI